MKYKECKGCYHRYNGNCIRPKGELCPGRIVTENEKKNK